MVWKNQNVCLKREFLREERLIFYPALKSATGIAGNCKKMKIHLIIRSVTAKLALYFTRL